MKKVYLLLVLCFLSLSVFATNWYTYTGGTGDATVLTNWTSDATGATQPSSPAGFGSTGDAWFVISPMSLSTNWGPIGGTLTISGAGTLSAGSNSIYLNGDWANNAGASAFVPGTGTVFFTGTVAEVLGGTSSTTFNVLNIENTGAGSTTIGNAGITVNSALDITSGTLTSLGSGVINDRGDWVNNSGATAYVANSSTVNFNGTAVQNIGGTYGTNFNNVTDNNSTNTLNVNLSINVAGTLTAGAGSIIFPIASAVINNGGAAGTLTGTGTIDVTRTAATADLVNQYKFSTYTLTGLTTNYSGIGAQTIDGSGTVGNYGTLTTSEVGTKTLGGAITVNTGINIGSSTVLDANSAGNYQITDDGAWTNSGGFTAESGTVVFNSATGNTITGSTSGSNQFYNVQFTGGGSWSFAGASFGASNSFTITSGTVTAPGAAYSLTIGGSYSNSGTFTNNGGNVIMNGSGANTMNGAMTGTSKFNNLTFSGTGSWNFAANVTDVAGNLTISSGTVTAPSTTLNIEGGYSNSGTFTNNSGTVIMDGTASGLTLSGNMTAATNSSFYNLSFTSTGSYVFNSSADVAGTFLQSSGTVAAPSGNLNVGGAVSNIAFNHTGGTFNPNGGTVTVNNASAATIAVYASGMTAPGNSFNNLTFNGAAGSTWNIENTCLIAGNFSNLSTTGTAQIPTGITISVGGSWNNQGNFAAGSGNTVFMTGTSGSLTLAGNMSGSNKFNSLTFLGNGALLGADWAFANAAEVGGNLTITAGNVTAPSTTLTVDGSYVNNATFTNNGGTVLFTGTPSAGTISGSLTGTNKFNNVTFTGGAYTFSNSADLAGNLNIANTTTGAVTAPAVLKVGGNWVNNSALGTSFVAGTGIVMMTGATGSYSLSGATSNMIGANSFYNLDFTGGASYSFPSNSVTVLDSFNVYSGTVTAPGSAYTFTIGNAAGAAGNFTNDGVFTNNGGTVTFAGSSASNGYLMGGMTGANKFNNLIFQANGGTYTLSAAADLSGSFTQTSGNIVAPSGNLSVGGNFTQSANNFNPNGGTVTLTSAGAATLTTANMNTAGTSSFYNLTFNGVGGSWSWTAPTNITVANNFTITNGTVTAPSADNITVTGSWANNGSFVSNGGTVTMNGSAAGLTLTGNLTAATNGRFNNLTFSGSGSWDFLASNADVAGVFAITGSGTVTAPNTNLNVGGNFNKTSGSFAPNGGTVTMNGASSSITFSGALAAGTNSFNNLSFNAGTAGTIYTISNSLLLTGNFNNVTTNGTVSVGANTLTVGGNWSNLGSFTAGTGTVTMNGTTSSLLLSGNMSGVNKFNTLTFNGAGGAWSFSTSSAEATNLNINAGTVTAPSSTLTIDGNYFLQGGGTGSFTNNGGTVVFTGTSATLTGGVAGAMTGSNKFNNLTFSGTSYSFGSNSADVAGNLLITSGALTAPASGYTLQVAGNWTNNSTAAPSFIANGGQVNMNGSSGSFTIGGTASLVTNPFYNLTFNGGANWSFGSTSTTVSNNFMISSGTVTAPSGTLTVGANYTNNGNFVNNSGTVVVGTGAASTNLTINGSLTGSNKFNNLTLDPGASSTVTFGSAAEVGGAYNASAYTGTVVAPSSSLTIDGSFTQTTGNFNPNGGTVIFSPSSAGTYTLDLSGVNSIGTSWFNNLTFNGTSSTFNFSPAASFAISGNFYIQNGTVVAPLSQTITVGGNWTNNGTFTSNSGTVNMSNSAGATLTLSGNMTGASNGFNNLTFTGNGNWSFGSSAADVFGNFNLSGVSGGSVTAPSSNLNVAGSWQNTGVNNFNNNNGTVTMNGAGTFSLSGNMTGIYPSGNRFNNLVFNNIGGTWGISSNLDAAGNFTVTNGTVNNTSSLLQVFGNFSTATGTTFSAGTGTINAGGSWNSQGTFTAVTSNVVMNGAGSFSISGSPVFYNLTFNNAAGNWSFGSSLAIVNNNFTIQAGDVTAPTASLSVGNNFTNNGGSFANNGGTVIMTGSGTISATYPGSLVAGNKFANITFNGGNNTITSSADVAGNLTISTGSLTAPGTGLLLQVAGSWTDNSPASPSFNANSGSVNMNATSGAYTIGGTATLTGVNSFYNLSFNGGASWNFGVSQVQANNNFNIISGSVTAPSSILFLGGNSTTSTFTNYGTFLSNTGLVEMINTTPGIWTFTGSFTGSNAFNNFELNSNGSTKFTSDQTVGGQFTNIGGTFIAPPGNMNVVGNFDEVSGTFNPNDGNVNMTGTSGITTMTTAGMNSVGTSSFYNLIFNGSGASVWSWSPASSFAIANNFSIVNGTVNAPAASMISVGGSWSNTGSFVASTGTTNMTGTVTGLTLSGSLTGANKFNNLTFSGTGAWSFGSTAADVAVNFLISGTGTVTAPSSLLRVGGNWTNTAGSFANNGGSVNMTGSGTLSGLMSGANAFNNITFNGTTYTFSSNADATGNFTTAVGSTTSLLNAGTYNIGGNVANSGTLNSGTTTTMNVGGNWSNLGSFSSSTGTVNMNGSGSNSLSGLMTGANKFNVLSFSGTGAWTFGSSNADVASNLTINSGDVTGPSGNLNVGGNWTNNGGTFSNNSGTVTMNGGAAVTQNFNVSGTGSLIAPNAFNNLTLNGTATTNYSFNARATANGNLTNNNGTINTNGNTLTVGGNFSNVAATSTYNNTAATDTLYVGGNFNNSGTFTAGANGTVNMTGGVGSYNFTGAMTGANAFNNLIYTGGGNWSFGNNNATVNNNFYIASGTVTAPSATATVGLTIGDAAGTFTNNGSFVNNGGTVIFTSTLGTTNNGSINGNLTGANKFNNVLFNGTSASTYTFNASADVAGTFTETTGNVVAPSGNLNVAGAFTQNSGNFNPNGGTVTMNGTTSGTINVTLSNMNTLSVSDFYNLTFNGGASTTWNITSGPGFIVANNFLNSNGNVNAPSSMISVGGNWTNSSVFNAGTGTVDMFGTGTLNGNLTALSNGKFNNLTFSNLPGTTYTFTTDNADVAGTFTQSGGGIVVAPPINLNVAGAYTHNLGSFNANGGTVTMNGNAAGQAITWSGAFTAGTNSFNNLIYNPSGAGTLTINNSLLIAGNFTNNVATATVAPGAGLTLTVGGNWTNNGIFTANSGNVVMNGTTGGLELNGNMTTSAPVGAFYNLTFNGVGGAWNINSANAYVTNNMAIVNGNVTAPVNTLYIGVSYSNSVTSTYIAPAGSTMNLYNSAAAGSLNGNLTGSSSLYNLTFSGTNVYTFNPNPTTVTLQGSWNNASSGTVNAGTYIYNVGGNYNNNSAGTFNCGTSTFNMDGTMTGSVGTYSLTGTMTSVGGEFYAINFNGGTYTFDNNAQTVSNFTINSGGTVNAPISAGTLTIGDQVTTTTTANYTNNGNFNNNGGTVIMQGASATTMTMVGNMTGSNRFNNLQFASPSQTYTFGIYPAEVYGNYSQIGASNNVIAPASTTLTIWGNFTNTSAGNFNPNNGTVVMNSNTATLISPTTNNMNTVGTSSFYNLTFNGVAGTSQWSWNANPSSFAVANNFIINGGTVTAPTSIYTVTVGGNWTNNGVFVSNQSTICMAGTSSTLSLNGNMTKATNGAFFNLTFGARAGLAGTGTWAFANPADIGSTYSQVTNNTVVAPSVLQIGGTFYKTTGSFNPNVALNGTVIMNAGLAGGAGSASPVTVYSMTTTSMTTVPPSGTPSCFNNLVFNGGAGIGWELPACSIYGNTAIYTGTVTAGPTNGTGVAITAYGSWLNLAAFNSNLGTINFNGFVPGLTLNGNLTNATHGAFYNVNFLGAGGAGQYTFDTAADIAGALVIGSGTATPTVIAPATFLNIYGNFSLNGGSFNNNGGTVSMTGIGTPQVLGGSAASGMVFNNLIINNGSGVTMGSSNGVPETVNNTLTLQSGRLTLGASATVNNNLILGSAATAISTGSSASFSYANMIVERSANTATSRILKMYSGVAGPYLFPVGDTVTNSYTPITLTVSGGTFGAGTFAGIHLYPYKDRHNANVSNYLNRFWYVTMDSVGSPAYSATSTYVPGDVFGAENKLSAGQYGGSLPWLKFGPTNTTTHTLTFPTVNTATSEFTAIDSTKPVDTALSSGGTSSATICFGQSTQLHYRPAVGDPTITYSWAPATYLNSTVGDTVVATPPVTTVFTVTVTDGNGFIGQSYVTVNVNPLPNPITGATVTCTGQTTTLVSGPSGGAWSSSDNFQASVNASTGAVNGLAAGTPFIYYTLPTGCYDSTQVTVNPSPVGISGTLNACIGLTSTLSDATPGGTWNTSSGSLATVSSTGIVTGVGAGVPTISYVLTTTGCYAVTPFTVNANPTAYNVTGGGGYCAGGTGVSVGLSGSSTSVVYNLYDGSALAGTETGTGGFGGGALNFGLQTAGGTYTVIGSNSSTGCSTTMNGTATVTVNALPTIDTLSAGGSYCAGGAGVDVTLNTSTTGINYQLYNDGVLSGAAMSGTSGLVDFGNQTAPGNYTAIATNTVTGCVNTMYGVASIIENATPVVYSITGGGVYCSMDSGIHVGLSFGDPGINYELKIGGVPESSSITLGASSTLDFGLQTTGGTYTAIATNVVNGCTSTMTGSVNVTVNPLPTALAVTSSAAAYCAGGAGVSIMVPSSVTGINYQLLNAGSPLGDTLAGTGGTISFNGQTLAGTYTVQGINATTGCVNMMANPEVININPLPTVETLSGTGSYCSGGTGVNVTLGSSQTGVNYTVYNNGTLLPGYTSGTGSSISLGMETLAGVYKAVATNTVTGCSSNMNDSAIITVDPLPTVYTVTGGGSYCANTNGVHIGLSYGDVGVNYEVKLGGAVVAGPVAGSNESIDFGVLYTGGTYTVEAINSVTGCTKAMGTATIVVNPLPTQFVVAASASSYCFGGSGISITLDNSLTGYTYTLVNGSLVDGILAGSTGNPLHFGYQTAAGTYLVVGKNNTTGCVDTMTGSAPVAINPLPTAYAVTGGGSYCAGGTGVNVNLSNSDTGVNYKLLDGTGTIVSGTGSGISFGAQTAGGTYTVQATDLATTCVNTMSGSVAVVVNPLPTVDTLLGGGGYCAGSAGADITLSNSSLEVNYQLYIGGTAEGLPISGTGHGIDLGTQTATGDYTVVATNVASGCINTMYGTVPVSINPLPRPYTVLGGGGYCVGGIGVIDSLSGSDLGNNYILYRGYTPVDTMAGTGMVLNYGYQTAGGIYNVVAYNVTTGCRNNMIYSDTVTINPLPVAYDLTGGGNYCIGGSGVHVGLHSGVIGINYQLYNDTTMVGGSVAGDGLPLDFGLETRVGTYHVVATSVITGCSNNMADSVNVGLAPTVTPSVSIYVAGGDTVCSGSTVSFIANPVNGGSSPMYQWSVNGVFEATGDTFNYVPNNHDNVSVVVTSDAACVFPVTGSTTIVMTVHDHEMPTASITATPGTSVCPGTPVTFASANTFAGTAPQFYWIVNSTFNAGSSSFTYTPDNRDYVILMMISNYPCRLMDTVFSNDIIMNVDTLTPSVSISAHPGIAIAKGQWDTLVAVATNAGTKPTFQWYVNGASLVGDTTNTLVSNQFLNGDSVTCMVTTGGGACSGVSVFNSIKIAVNGNVGVAQISSSTGASLRVSPNPNKGAFSIIGSLGTTTDETVGVDITDMLGQTVYTGAVESKKGNVNAKVEVSNALANGVYLLTLHSTSGTTILHMVIEQQ